MRKLLTAGMAALICLAMVTAPASARSSKPPSANFSYTATIDCGQGPITVGSFSSLWTDLVDVETSKRYKPVAWEIFLPGRTDPIVAAKPASGKPTVECSYDDGGATGTVTVLAR
jgi:hypothetical protein